MAEGFRFMPLGLVRLRTFQLSAWVSQMQHERRCSRARGGWTCHSDVKKNSQIGEYKWRHAPEARRGLREILKKSVSSVEFCLGRWRLAFACSPKPGQWPCGGCHTCCGGRWKSQNRKNVYLSNYVEEPLNSKLIKSFVRELRSRTCFLCFEVPMFYVYML